MSKLSASIKIDDEDAPDLFDALREMEIEEDHKLAALFRIQLAMQRDGDGLWAFLDDERLRPWKKVVIAVIAEDEETELMTGYITQLQPRFDLEENQCYLEIQGLDTTCLMGLEEKIKDWPNKSDSDIAGAILQDYNLTPEVETTSVTHEEAVATIIQRETDIQFLKRLARRNGFECYVAGDKGYFRKPALDEEPQPVLAMHFGDETNLVSFEARLNAMRPTAVEMHQYDTIGKDVLDAVSESNEQRRLGSEGAESLTPPDGKRARLFVRQHVTTGRPEMENLCRALFDEAEWLIEARGEIDSAAYGAALRAHAPVPIKGVGELLSGLYYVTSVRHVFRPDGYTQHFTARRNAMIAEDGDFGGGGGLLGGLL